MKHLKKFKLNENDEFFFDIDQIKSDILTFFTDISDEFNTYEDLVYKDGEFILSFNISAKSIEKSELFFDMLRTFIDRIRYEYPDVFINIFNGYDKISLFEVLRKGPDRNAWILTIYQNSNLVYRNGTNFIMRFVF
jgi:hypothetical protein